MASASAPCVTPSGSRNSSVSISPTETGLRLVINIGSPLSNRVSPVAVIVQIDAPGFASAAVPPEYQSPLLVHTNRMPTFQIAAQLLETIARRHPKILIGDRIVDHLQLAKQAGVDIRRHFSGGNVVDEEGT